MTVIEVFADVGCPFTHVGLRRFVELRTELDRPDVTLRVRAWPLEIINGRPLSASFVAEEVDDIREQVAPTLFEGFEESSFPASSLPALTLAAAAYEHDHATGERVSLALRDLLFEEGVDIADVAVLQRLAADHVVSVDFDDTSRVLADHADGVARGVVGSPHFFTPTGGFFCPALDIHRESSGHLRITADVEGFQEFLHSCLS
jgi:predicted DsbA family dithiol-disulfide isomerase